MWKADAPLWLVFLLVEIPTTAAWLAVRRRRRLAGSGRCPECGYDLGGLARTEVIRCPECGRAAPALATAMAEAAAKSAW